MKKVLFVAVLIVSTITLKHADAQLRVSLNLNIGNQPAWGPTGYDRADYYYMPDIDTYYSVNNHDYVYNNGGQWIHSGALPPRYANYDLYNGYKVVVNQPNPWLRANTYRTRYAGYRGRRGQEVIRDSRDDRYRNHWNGPGNNGRGNAYGHYKDHGWDGDDRGHGHDDHGDHGHDDHNGRP